MRPSGRKPDQLRAVSFERGVYQTRRRLLPRPLRRYPCAVHRLARREGAALAEGRRQGLGHRRIRHAAARHRRAHAPRGGERQAIGPHPGNPAPDRPQPARRGRSGSCSAKSRSRSTATCSRPMAAPAPRRSPAAGSRCTIASHGWTARGMFKAWPAEGPCRRDLLRHPRRRAGARSRLCRGFERRHRRQFRHDRQGRHRRGPGHGGGRAVLARTACSTLLALAQKGIGELVAMQKAGDRMTRSSPASSIVVATHNKGKLEEFRELFEPYGVEAVSAGELGLRRTGGNREHIRRQCPHQGAGRDGGIGPRRARRRFRPLRRCARRRARRLHRRLGRTRPRLDRWPCGNVEEKLAGRGRGRARTSAAPSFNCTLCVLWPDGAERIYEGRAHGQLVWPPRGQLGHGYDPDVHARRRSRHLRRDGPRPQEPHLAPGPRAREAGR